jgi:hypothetical protein
LSQALAVASNRAEEVLNTIRQKKTSLLDELLTLGELLSEAKRDNHPQQLGYDNYGAWLEATGLDLKERQSYYLIGIVDKAKTLDIPRQKLLASKMSKLKEIFTLNPETQGDAIRELVDKSVSLKLEEIQDAVQNKKGQEGQERFTWRNFKVSESVAETVVDPAVERCKAEYGDTIDSQTGEVRDISDGRALELICADFNARPDELLAAIEAIPTEE